MIENDLNVRFYQNVIDDNIDVIWRKEITSTFDPARNACAHTWSLMIARSFIELCSRFKSAKNASIVLLFYAVAAIFFSYTEGWNALTSVYFLTTTITTVGFGDVAPDSRMGRIVGMVAILFALSVVFPIIATSIKGAIEKKEALLMTAVNNDPTGNKEPHVFKVVMSLLMIVFCIVLGSAFLYLNGEFDENIVHCVWYSFATVTTVGYGDLTPQKESTRVFMIFFMLGSVLVTACAIGNISSVKDDIAREKKEVATLQRLDPMLLANLDSNGDGVDVNEFMIGMLLLMEAVDPKKVCRSDPHESALCLSKLRLCENAQIRLLQAQFMEHDRDGSGLLDGADLGIVASNEITAQLRKLLKAQGFAGEALEMKLAEALADKHASTVAPTQARMSSLVLSGISSRSLGHPVATAATSKDAPSSPRSDPPSEARPEEHAIEVGATEQGEQQQSQRSQQSPAYIDLFFCGGVPNE